jgi:hypothetical protein
MNRNPHILLFLLLAALFTACSSIDLPTAEESEARIARLSSDLVRAEAPLRAYERRFALKRDMRTIIDPAVINRVLRAVATQRSDDMRIGFPATRPLLEERKDLLGIAYTNRLDIDSGLVTLNLKRAELRGLRRGAIRVYLEMEGEGRIAVSGRYAGLPGKASPRIELSLRDTVTLLMKSGQDGGLTLSPAKQKVKLLTTFHVNLLGWEIPWREETVLQLDELLQPITMPGMLAGEIKLPAPAREYSTGRYEFVTIPVNIGNTEVITENDRITIQADVKYR